MVFATVAILVLPLSMAILYLKYIEYQALGYRQTYGCIEIYSEKIWRRLNNEDSQNQEG